MVINKKNFWEYELYDSKEKKLSISDISKAKYFTIYINESLQGLFEFNGKISRNVKLELIKKQSSYSLRSFRKNQKQLSEELAQDIRNEIKKYKKTDIWEYELFDKQSNKISSLELTKASYFAIYISEELQGLFEFPPRSNVKIKREILQSQYKKCQRIVNKIAKSKIEKTETIDINRYTKDYEETDIFMSPTYNQELKRYKQVTDYRRDFNIEEFETENIKFIYEKIELAIERANIKFRHRPYDLMRIVLKIKKSQDENYSETISTSYVTTKKGLKNAVVNMIKDFNKDKYIKEKYGEIFKEEFVAIEQLQLGILWKTIKQQKERS